MLSALPQLLPGSIDMTVRTPQCQEWVDSVYNSLSERERVAQLVVANLSPRDGEATKALIKKYVQDNGVGGLLFDEGTAEQYAQVINYAQSVAKVPVLITIDGEWATSMRIAEAHKYPYNMSLGAISDSRLLYEYGKAAAKECKALGIQVDFAPVIDVNSNPKNPIIGKRSFGELPRRVAELGKQYARGMQDGGVMAVAKHFPGHGDTDLDSHKTLPTVGRSFESLDSIDLLPYRAFDGSGIMVAHLSVPALDPSGVPASMSRPIVTDFLRKKMGFKGLIFTDGLMMKGAKVDGMNSCVAALKAGNDILLGPARPIDEIDAVMAALNRDEISKSEIEASVKRLLAYKYALGLARLKKVDPTAAKAILNSPEIVALIDKLTCATMTVVKKDGSILPIGNLAKNKIALVNIGAEKGNNFDKMCQNYAKVDVFSGSALGPQMVKELGGYNTTIACVFADSESARQQMQKLRTVPGLVAVMLIDPYKVGKYAEALKSAKAILLGYDNTAASRSAAAQALFGGIDVDGVCPVNIPGVAKAGQGLRYPKSRLGYATPAAVGLNPDMSARIDSAMYRCIADKAFPGAQVIVGRKGEIVFDKCYGATTGLGEKVTEQTLYDLASVSKTVGTLPGVMKAYDMGLFELDVPASQHVPGLRVDGKDDLTPRQFLFHETGIKPSLNLFEIMMDSNTYKGSLLSGKRDRNHTVKIYNGLWGNPNAKMRTDIVSRTATEEHPIAIARNVYAGKDTYDTIMGRIYGSEVYDDRKCRYSCLNFSILMDLEQRVTGIPHDRFVADSVWGPIGAYNFTYRPLEKYPVSQIAATENDVYLRKQHVRGYVHDELCAFSGGVQGNAGVFGTATDVAKLCQTWLNGGTYGDARIYTNATNKLFTTEVSPNSRRGLGFDKPDADPDKSPTTELANLSVYGHLGFTGTCFWIDPTNDFFVVFLCNRVDPSRNNAAFSKAEIRPTIMRIVYESLK